MVTSEYTRYPRKELKYLMIAFATLTFQKLVAVVVLGNIVFGDLVSGAYSYFFVILNHGLETLAILLLVNAFLYPFIAKKYHSIRTSIEFQALIVGSTYFIFEAWHVYNYLIDNRGPAVDAANIVFTAMKISLLVIAVYILSSDKNPYKYRYSIAIAFMTYLIAPLLKMIAFLGLGSSSKLFVAAIPFPILGVILFARVMYLKLADKANIIKELDHEKELSKMKNKFISIVSHELRTPLTSIGLYASLLRDNKFGKMSKGQKNAASIIKDETSRLNSMVNDLLDLSKIEAGKMKLRMGVFDLCEFSKKNIFLHVAKEKGIKIISKVPNGCKFKVDPEKFNQILINLISNAIKYTSKGGKITLSARKVSKGMELIVSDTGRGIPSEDLKKVFDKFYQVEHYMTREEGGTGLGLAIVYEIVKLHKGKVSVTSEVGKGTTFTVFIPKGL